MYTQSKPPLDELAHHGVLGMRWGHRKDRSKSDAKPKLTGYIKAPIVRKLSNGDTLTLEPIPPNKFIRTVGKASRKYTENYNNASSLNIKDKNGKKVGHAAFWLQGKDDIYLNWITIEKSARGQGYASEVMKAAVEHGKQTGRKRLVLEVPGISPDARHIYEKLGFKATKQVTEANKDSMWGGLTQMVYEFH